MRIVKCLERKEEISHRDDDNKEINDIFFIERKLYQGNNNADMYMQNIYGMVMHMKSFILVTAINNKNTVSDDFVIICPLRNNVDQIV